MAQFTQQGPGIFGKHSVQPKGLGLCSTTLIEKKNQKEPVPLDQGVGTRFRYRGVKREAKDSRRANEGDFAGPTPIVKKMPDEDKITRH